MCRTFVVNEIVHDDLIRQSQHHHRHHRRCDSKSHYFLSSNVYGTVNRPTTYSKCSKSNPNFDCGLVYVSMVAHHHLLTTVAVIWHLKRQENAKRKIRWKAIKSIRKLRVWGSVVWMWVWGNTYLSIVVWLISYRRHVEMLIPFSRRYACRWSLLARSTNDFYEMRHVQTHSVPIVRAVLR